MFEIKDFKLHVFIEAAEELLRCDETKRALDLLDNLPAYYRQNLPNEVTELKREIYKRMATPSFYATHQGWELEVTDEMCEAFNGSLRVHLIKTDVKLLNDAGLKPHIFDLGPGEMFLPLLLHKDGLDFSYEPIYVNHPTFEKHKRRADGHLLPLKAGQPTIFVATEILEHLWNPMDIRYEMKRICDVVHISTPLMTFNPNCMDWKEKEWLGHLNAFTFDEFRSIVSKMFFDYEPCFYESQVQHARLIYKESAFSQIKVHYQLDLK